MPLTQQPSAGKLLSVSAPTIDRNSRIVVAADRSLDDHPGRFDRYDVAGRFLCGPFYAAYFRYHPEEATSFFSRFPPRPLFGPLKLRVRPIHIAALRGRAESGLFLRLIARLKQRPCTNF